MDLDQLRQFDAVATYGTISAAADELRMPQPTLSRSLQRLEQELGTSSCHARGVMLSSTRQAGWRWNTSVRCCVTNG